MLLIQLHEHKKLGKKNKFQFLLKRCIIGKILDFVAERIKTLLYQDKIQVIRYLTLPDVSLI